MEHLSEREQRFERGRQRFGLMLAPAVFAILWFVPVAALSPAAHQLLAILGLVVTLWISEAIPLPVTALLGPALCVVMGIGPVKEVFRGFSDPIIFLFLGSFLLAEGMLHQGLNRRIAFRILAWPGVGGSSTKLLAAFGGITALISMWVSNTATTAMMLPIGLAILSEMVRRESERLGRAVQPSEISFGTGLMLVTAFASSIGGVGTPVGSPPNLIGLGLIEKSAHVQIGFFQWMAFGVPVALVLVVGLILYLAWACPVAPGLMGGSAGWLASERDRLGKWRRGELYVIGAFAITVTLWVAPGLVGLVWGRGSGAARWLSERVPESVASLVGATLLFVVPLNFRRREFALTWNEARRIDWGTILLFGGGLALGELMFSTGLARWIGEGLAQALQTRTTFGLVVLFCAVAIVLTETTSNVAAATMVVPVAIAVAQAAGVPPVGPAIAACLGSSMAFMLPVSTPPNAIVYGSGYVPILKMVRHGLVLDLIAFVVIVAVVTWVVPLLLP